MKKIYYLAIVLLAVSFQYVNAQSGLAGTNYQAVARNANGTILGNQSLAIRFSVLGGSTSGPVQYQETHNATTNNLGLFTLQIGKGTPLTGTYSTVPWANANQYLKVEISVNGSNFSELGTSQLMSVPYALYAANGNPGPAGLQGIKGDAGVVGPTGPIGPTGVTGPAGPQGIKGDAGAIGPAGPIGLTGAIGPAGSMGIKGDAGTAGPAGVTGPIGPAGPVGIQGAKGNPGAVGPAGVTGPIGPAGPVGIQGAKGDPGAVGPAGVTGPIGPAGIQGIPGVPGLAGATGPAGPAGNINGVAAAGDLSGNYPAPLVAGLQGKPISNVAPVAGQILKFDGAQWLANAAPVGAFVLPYAATENNAASLFSITNAGDGTSLEGISNSVTSSITAIKGTVTSTTPGGFSAAVRGINNGTGGLGIGMWGSHNGSGWGVYGVTPNGIGVYGNSSAAGNGVFANSNTGTGLFATSTNGIAANIAISNNANANNVLTVSTLGAGTAITATGSSNYGVDASSTGNTGVQGTTAAQTAAGLIGNNTGGGEAIVGRTISDIAGAVVGRNDGGGYGVRGFIAGNATGTGIGVFGQVGLTGSTGSSGRFENMNADNTSDNLVAYTNTKGDPGVSGAAAAGAFEVNNTNSVAPAVKAKINSIYANFGAAALFGESAGTGGFAGLFYTSNNAATGNTVVAINNGGGNAIVANTKKNGNGVESNVNGTGKAIYGWIPSFGMGQAGDFENFNDANTATTLTAKTIGNGTAGYFEVDNTKGTSPAIHGKVNSQFSNFGTAGIYGESAGTGGFGGLFYASNVVGNGAALISVAKGNGNAITASASNLGDGVESSINGTGNAIYGWVPNSSSGRAARFSNFNTASTTEVLLVETQSSGNLAVFKSGSPGVNVARINSVGKGFFNGGTQTNGADVAESFAVSGPRDTYEPGDVLVIATHSDRMMEKSSEPYSTLVAGVFATKPGMLLSEKNVDANLSDEVPMGVIGVIPTKVCNENGMIHRGDLLVTSSKAGYAMKADIDKVKPGQVIGKALAEFDGAAGKINVLVNVK